MSKTRDNSWKKAKEERDKPKFLSKGIVVHVLPLPEPIQVTIQGKFGPRQMYIVETEELGKIYVTPQVFIQIATRMEISGYEVPVEWP